MPLWVALSWPVCLLAAVAEARNIYTCIHVCVYMFPLFQLPVYEIRLGTVDQPDADVEWRYKPYMNTSKKRLVLSEGRP